MSIILVLIIILIASVALYTAANTTRDRMLFRATHDMTRTPEDMGWGVEEAQLNVNGEKTLAWHIPAQEASKHAIIFSHGNAGNISDRLESISIFRTMGYNVIAYDYGGYGVSTGKPSEQRCYNDLRAVFAYTTEELGFAPSNIILLGRSLGAGPTAQIATETKTGAVILESTFTSVSAIAKTHHPLLSALLPQKDRFNNLAKVGEISTPLLIIHGKEDTLIPYQHGQALYEKATAPKEFLQIHGEHHEGFWKSGALYTEGLQNFFNQHLK